MGVTVRSAGADGKVEDVELPTLVDMSALIEQVYQNNLEQMHLLVTSLNVHSQMSELMQKLPELDVKTSLELVLQVVGMVPGMVLPLHTLAKEMAGAHDLLVKLRSAQVVSEALSTPLGGLHGKA